MSTTTIVLTIISAVCGVIFALWQSRLRRVHLETVARDSVLTDKEVEEAATIFFKGLAENAREPNTLYDVRPWLSENSHLTRVDLTRILLSLSHRGRLRIVRPVLNEVNEISFSGNWTLWSMPEYVQLTSSGWVEIEGIIRAKHAPPTTIHKRKTVDKSTKYGDKSTVVNVSGKNNRIKAEHIGTAAKGSNIRDCLPLLLAALQSDVALLPARERDEALALADEIEEVLEDPAKPNKGRALALLDKVGAWVKGVSDIAVHTHGAIGQITGGS